MLSLADRLTGLILGQAVGDALGAVVEARSVRCARMYVSGWLLAGRAGERGRGRHPFGQYTDDTQLARELMRSYTDAGRLDAAAFARRVAALFAAGEDVGAGPGTRAAAARLQAGVPCHEAGTPAPYAGNGAAMRAAPIGLLAPNGAELLTAATAHARVTHADPRAVAGGVAVAAAVAAAARPGPISPPAFLAEIAALAGEVDAEMAAALSAMSAWIGRRPAAALRAALAHGGEVAGPPRAQGIPAHVIPSVLWSVFAFLRAPDDYWATVTTAIWPGGDTDTTAAMAGAISGARLGTEAPPEELARRIHDRGRWTAAELSALAHRCAKLASA